MMTNEKQEVIELEDGAEIQPSPDQRVYPQHHTVTHMELIQIAVQRGDDLDKIERLMDLKDRHEATEARKAYVQAMTKFRAECPSIQKTRTAHNSKYAGLAETIASIKSLLSACGLSHSWTTKQDNGVIEVTCTVTHSLGHSESTSMMAEPDKSGSKNSIQAIGSTVTYLERYTLFSILGLASSDQDDDGRGTSGVDGDIKQRRLDIAELLKEAFSHDGPAIAEWLQKKKLPHVRTASMAQLDEIEKALGGR